MRIVLAIILAASCTPVFSQQVNEILERYFESVGGKEKIAQMQSAKEITSIEYFPMGDSATRKPPAGNSVRISKLPCYQVITSYDLKEYPVMVILNNDKGSTLVWNTDLRVRKDVITVEIDPAVTLLNLYNNKKLSFEREETRNGIVYDVIRSKDKRALSYYFNKENHFLDAFVSPTAANYITYYRDYRETNGIVHPFSQQQYGGDVMISNIKTSSMDFNPPIESNNIFYYKEEYQRKLVEPKVRFTSERLETGNMDLTEFIKTNFKGKRVFVDLWATWCGPCKMEFRNYSPSYYAFMDEHQTSLLYLSIDKDAQEKAWEKDIDRLGLKGYHARANKKMLESMSKDFFHDENFMIPRYIIFDENGEVVADDFLRPSNPEFEKRFLLLF